jgi:HSP20 family protein
MTLTRWDRPEFSHLNPLGQLSALREEIDRLFNPATSGLAEATQPFRSVRWPAMDVFEDRDCLTVRVEVAGMKKEDINISLHDATLTISGERKPNAAYESAETHRAERFAGRFQRSLSLPATVESEKCKATYQDGILLVVLPKREEAKPRQIQVEIKNK